MRILWLSWKDRFHPQAGGAEVVAHELMRRLVEHGHEVTLLCAGYQGAVPKEERDGYTIIRVGNRYSVYLHAYRYYRKHLRGKYDRIIEEVNTMPFFARFYARERVFLLFHQLARQVWFYQMPFPFSVVGYALEPIYLWLLRKNTVITVSESTKQDLARIGFLEKNIHIISEGIQLAPAPDLAALEKYPTPTLLSLGAVRPMKRTLDIVKAFEIAKETMPALTLIIAGDCSGAYGTKLKTYAARSRHAADMTVLGKVDAPQRLELLRRSHAIAVTSVREGWGLIVTEANSQGTPAIVYDVHGLRDSVHDGITGLIAKENTPRALAATLHTLLSDPARYEDLRTQAWQWSKTITFDKSYEDLAALL